MKKIQNNIVVKNIITTNEQKIRPEKVLNTIELKLFYNTLNEMQKQGHSFNSPEDWNELIEEVILFDFPNMQMV